MNINAAVDKIKNNRQHGASQLTRLALELIEQNARQRSKPGVVAPGFMSNWII